MNSSSSGLMSYCTLAIEFLELKYYTNYLFYQFFLSHPDFFFLSFFHSLRCRCFFFSHKPNEIKKIKEKKRKKRKERDMFMRKKLIQTQNTKQNPIPKTQLNQKKQIWKKNKPIGGEDDERWLERQWRPKPISPSLSPLSLSLSLCLSFLWLEEQFFFFFWGTKKSKWNVAGRFCRRKRNKRRGIEGTCVEENEMKE